MALYFQQIINAFIEGVINPIIAAILGESDYRNWGIEIGDAKILVGLVLDALITFCIVAFLLFLVIKLYNRMRAEPDAAPAAIARRSPCSPRSATSCAAGAPRSDQPAEPVQWAGCAGTPSSLARCS